MKKDKVFLMDCVQRINKLASNYQSLLGVIIQHYEKHQATLDIIMKNDEELIQLMHALPVSYEWRDDYNESSDENEKAAILIDLRVAVFSLICHDYMKQVAKFFPTVNDTNATMSRIEGKINCFRGLTEGTIGDFSERE